MPEINIKKFIYMGLCVLYAIGSIYLFALTIAGDKLGSVFGDVSFSLTLVLVLGIGMVAILYNSFTNEFTSTVIYVEKSDTQQEEDLQNDNEFDFAQRTLDIKKIAEDKKKGTKENLFSTVCKAFEAGQALVYEPVDKDGTMTLEQTLSYAIYSADDQKETYEYGIGFPGTVAIEKKTLVLNNIPEGYLNIQSGLGSSLPRTLLIIPALSQDNEVVAVFEIATWIHIDNLKGDSINELPIILGKAFNNHTLTQKA